MSRRRVLATVSALVGSAVAAGCTPTHGTVPVWDLVTAGPTIETSGIEQLPADHIASAVAEASAGAGAVHMVGAYQEPVPVDDNGQPIEDPPDPPRTTEFDVVGTPTRFHAVVTVADLTLELHRDGATVLARADEPTATVLGHPDLARGWVASSPEDEWLLPWLTLTDAPALIDAVLHPEDGVMIAVGPVLPGSPPLLQLDVTTGGRTAGTVTVRAQGDPLPTGLALSDTSGTGEISFSEWGTASVPDIPDLR